MILENMVYLLDSLKEGDFNVVNYRMLSVQDKVLLAQEFFNNVESNIDFDDLLYVIRDEFALLDNQIESAVEELVDEMKLFNMAKTDKEIVEWFLSILIKIDDFARYLRIEFMFGLIDCLNELILPTSDEVFVAYYFKTFELIVNLNKILINLSSITKESNRYNFEILIKLLREESEDRK